MTGRSRIALFALLAAATFVAGAAGPLHEIEAFRGHEGCAAGGDRESFRHVCHDEDHCTVCALLALPSVSEPGNPPALDDLPAAQAPSARPESAVAAALPTFAPARAPPVL